MAQAKAWEKGGIAGKNPSLWGGFFLWKIRLKLLGVKNGF